MELMHYIRELFGETKDLNARLKKVEKKIRDLEDAKSVTEEDEDASN